MHMSSFGFAIAAASLLLASAQDVKISSQAQADEDQSDLLVKSLGAGKYATRFPGVTWDNNAWTLTSTIANNFDWHTQSFVANGYFGSSFASTGPFPYFYPNMSGWPLFDERITFGTVAGFFDSQPKTNGSNFPWLYQYGWDSAISGLPAWGSLVLDLGNGAFLDGTVDESELSNVSLVQDFKQGLASYHYTWTPKSMNGTGLDVAFVAAADKLHPNRAYVRMQITSPQDMNATVVNILDGATALRTDPVAKGVNGYAIYSAVSPVGVSNVTAWVFATLNGSDFDPSKLANATDQSYISKNASTVAQSLPVSLRAGQAYTITKYVGVASTDGFTDPQSQARNEMTAGVNAGFDSAVQQHVQEWATVLPASSVTNFSNPATGEIPYNLIERQITNVVAEFMLLMNTVSENAMNNVNQAPINTWGISVCGLTSDCYAGQRFWDEDVWMQPFLAAVHPFEAKQISLSRTAQYPQAKANAQTAYQSSQYRKTFSENAAAYAWTTGRYGNCTATGPCFDYEYHLNGDIVKSFINYWAASGDDKFFMQELLPVTNSIATLYSEVLDLNSTTNTWELRNMTDPDEYANFVDNGGFTMALVRQILLDANFFNVLYGQTPNDTWTQQAMSVEIPLEGDALISLEYSGMNGSIEVKQADVVLRTYPLNDQLNYTLENQLNDVNYYADRQSPDGPGMTYAIFSIDASFLEPSGCSAYTYDLNAWSPYIRGPWFTFSEQLIDDYDTNGGTNPAYPFLTGFGGFLQIDLMGYLGLRYNTSYNMQVSPNLPPQIPYIRYPTFHFQGWPVDAWANQTHTTITRPMNAAPLNTANQTYANAPMTVQIGVNASDTRSLSPGGTLVLPNIRSADTQTIQNNVLQCQPVANSEGSTVPGQFPQAAVDGGASTRWQAASATNNTNSLTIDLTNAAFAPVDHVYVDWAGQPASNFSVIFHNGTSYSEAPVGVGRVRMDVATVNISRPYDATQADLVRPYVGNSTNISMSDMAVWTGRYATLLVGGNQADNSSAATGPSVAEWAVVVVK